MYKRQAGYAAYYRTALAPIEEESRIGDSLAEHQAEVAAARSADEMLAALEGEGGLLPVLRQNTAAYVDLADKCKAEGMTAETYAEYAALTEICYSLNAGIEEMEAALAQAKAAADPLEKESALAVIQSRIIEGGDLYRLSETAVTAAAAAQTALDTLQAQKAVEEAQKQQNQTGTSGGSRISSGSGSGGSSSSSGGSRSSSNRGSGSSNGSTDSTGGSDSSTSSTGSGSSSGSGGDSSSGGSSGPTSAGGAD